MSKEITSQNSMAEIRHHKAWAEIDTSAIRYNYRYLRDIVREKDAAARFIAVVKADAYAHGVEPFVRIYIEEGCDFFAVSSIEEALEVRSFCKKYGSDAEILILGYVLPSDAKRICDNNIIISILSEEYARLFNDEAKKEKITVKCHLAYDTGLNRIGLSAITDGDIEISSEAAKRICDLENLDVCGAFSHFGDAEYNFEETKRQYERYMALDASLEARGVHLAFKHICNSVAALSYPEYYLDGVRIGIMLYGVAPNGYKDKLKLLPVMKLRTIVSHVHPIKKGQTVGYRGAFVADMDMEIATLPVGYADGINRKLGGYEVTVHSANGAKKAKILGYVCMDQCMIDVTGMNVNAGDIVTIFGNDVREITLFAEKCGSIEHECFCCISSRIARVII